MKPKMLDCANRLSPPMDAEGAWYADGSKSRGQARVIDALGDLSDKIDREFADEPDVAAELHHKFSEVFVWVSRTAEPADRTRFLERRRFHALRALELRVRAYGEWHELVAKDLFYSYSLIGRTDNERAELLMRAIRMMRHTNPQNLNLAYMLGAYSAYLIGVEYSEDVHQAFRNAASAQTGEDRFQIAEPMLRESLPIFRLHYKTANAAVNNAECRLSYVLAMQRKWTESDEHLAVCRANRGNSPDGAKSGLNTEYLDLIERARREAP